MSRFAGNGPWGGTALVWLLLGIGGRAPGGEYFVAPDGADANPGTQPAPFRTIQKAADVMVAGDTCRIRAGTYRETVRPARSGTDGAPITFEAFHDERVVISGADLVSGPWKQPAPTTPNVHTAGMTWTLGPGKDMVFVDGIPLIQARHPNTHTAPGSLEPPPIGLPPLWMTYGDFRAALDSPDLVNPTDLDQEQPDHWKGALYVGWHGWGWCLQSAEVQSSRQGSITVTRKTGRFWFPDCTGKKNMLPGWQRGYLTNHRNALDKPGEWHWEDDTLHLWAPDGKDPSPRRVEAKKRHLAFDLRGRDHVTLKGLRIFASSVTMADANHCVVDGCRMSFVSHYTWFDDNRDGYIDDWKVQDRNGAPQRGEVGVYVGGKSNVIKDSVIKYSAGAGLILAGHRTTVTNSIIHDCGYVGTYLGCIFVTYDPEAHWKEPRGGHAITRNELYRAGRSLINVQAHPTPDVKKPDVYEAMDIGHNRGHDGAVTANDGGGFFYSWRTTLGTGESRTQIHHNLIWDVWGCAMNALVYPDNATFKLDVHHNLLWQSSRATLGQAGRKSGYFFKRNPPGDTRYVDNAEKSTYDGGVEGLEASDYPGGSFETGPTIRDEDDSWYE